jgi:hypothetical protein
MEAAEAVETIGNQAYEDVLATVIINKVRPITQEPRPREEVDGGFRGCGNGWRSGI